MKHNLEIFSDQLDDIILYELKEALASLEDSLKFTDSGNASGTYSYNLKEDRAQIKKTIKAYKRVIEEWEMY